MNPRHPLHVLVIFTGGTIASRNAAGTLKMSETPYRLLEDIPTSQHVFECIEPLNTFSENMTPEMLWVLFSSVSEKILHKRYDGLIIVHGTDTLAYTAQLADLLLSCLDFPVVVLGSKLPIDILPNDGIPNFHNALALLTQIQRGVYVVSRAQNGTDYVHHAGKIMQADSLTDDFQSYGGLFAGIMLDGSYHPNSNASALSANFKPRDLLTRFTSLRQLPLLETVLALDACVGMNYLTIDLSRPEYTYIVQRLYHSGTSCTAPRTSPYSLLFLQDLCKENSKKLYMAPIESLRTPYSTTRELLNAGIIPVFDLPFEAVWAGLLLCTWLKIEPEEFFSSPG